MSSAISNSISAGSMPSISPSLAAKAAGHPPAWPLKIACIASCWRSSARASNRKPMLALVPSSQMFPSNHATAAKLRPSRFTSPKLPSFTCQSSTPSQSPSVGGWANVHGQGMAHLQTSNQSPTRCQLGISAIPLTSIGCQQRASSDRRIPSSARQGAPSYRGTRASGEISNPNQFAECRHSSPTHVFRYRLDRKAGLHCRANLVSSHTEVTDGSPDRTPTRLVEPAGGNEAIGKGLRVLRGRFRLRAIGLRRSAPGLHRGGGPESAMAAPPEWMPPELYEKMHAAFERARAERLDMELAQAVPHEASDPRTRAYTGAFLILESERRAIAARLRRHYWRHRDRYRDLDAITKLTQLEYEHLAGRLGQPTGPPLGGDSPADWAESWGSGPMLEMGTAFIFYRGQRDRLGRRLPSRTRTRVDAAVAGYGIGVSRSFQKAMGEWTPDLEPERIWPASTEQGAEITAAQAAGAKGAATAAWRRRRPAWPRTATTA